MNKPNTSILQVEVEKKYSKKDKRKKKNMKVSGASVKNIQKIIREKQ